MYNSKTKRLIETSEMRVVREIFSKILRDRIRSKNMRKICGVQDVADVADREINSGTSTLEEWIRSDWLSYRGIKE